MILGTVIALRTLAPAGDGLPRTELDVATDQGLVHVVLPGTNGAPPVVVPAVPRVEVGQQWSFDLEEAGAGLVPRGLGRGMRLVAGAAAPPWVLTGVHFDDALLPMTFLVNDVGAVDLGLEATEAEVEAALSRWSDVGCTAWEGLYGGTTPAGYGDDGENVLTWYEADWLWGEAAGITAVHYEVVGDEGFPASVDIMFNAQDWAWDTAPGDAYAAIPRLNAASIVTHELGHAAGLDHENELIAATMFFGYVGGDWMATPSGDDRRGLCEGYPSGGDECADDDDCAFLDGTTCRELDGVGVCDEPRDDVGAACSRTSVNCTDYCVFTNGTATAGYCSVACDGDDACPAGYACGTPDLFLYDDPAAEDRMCVVAEGETGGDSADPAPVEAAEGCGCAAPTGWAPWAWLAATFAVVRRKSGGCR